MKICIVGAGAIGGFLAARFAHAGHTVSVVIRGPHLEAVRRDGLTLITESGERLVSRVTASAEPAELGPAEVVILALKAHQLAAFADRLAQLLTPETLVVSMQNGVPWWYFQGQDGPWRDHVLESVDPGGRLARTIDWRQVIGSIAYPACVVESPGVIRQIEGNRFPLGEIGPNGTSRLRDLAQVFRDAGFKTPVVADLRAEIWLKLWGNVSFNPISALTRATLEDICTYPATRALARSMMLEAQAVATALGVAMKVDVERRIEGARSIGQHKTSMLQDVEAHRPLELDALVGSVLELGQLTSTPTPVIAQVHALASLLAQSLAAARS